MFQNLLTISFRLIKRNPFYFLINLTGLTLGISCCILIACYVMNEWSYDRFHTRAEYIYRVNYDVTMGGTQTISPSVPVFVAPEIKSRFPEVTETVRFLPDFGERTIRHDDKLFDEKGFAWADSSFFNVLDFKFIKGDARTALNRPGTVVLTASMARKYFGDQDPVGKVLNSNNNRDYEVSAVIEDVPSNSHFSFDFLTSLYSIKDLDESVQWNNPNYTTFLLVQPGADVAGLQTKIETWVNPPTQDAQNTQIHLVIEPLTKVHFNTDVFNFGGKLVVIDFSYLIVFSAIAFLILVIASVNYINLATSRASKRAKEVGLRKSTGATSRQLVAQFLAESFFMVMPALALSLILVQLSKPLVAEILGRQISYTLLQPDYLVLLFVACTIFSVAAGIYPALVLTRFKAVNVLKGNYSYNVSGQGLRHALVVVQFVISTALIACTFIVLRQVEYMQSTKLGIDKEQVVLLNGNAELKNQLEGFLKSIENISGVEKTSAVWRSPFRTVNGNGMALTGKPDNNTPWVLVGGIAGDENYLPTLGIELKAGRNFDPAKTSGGKVINEFIVNETFLKEFDLTPEEAIGKEVMLGLVSDNGGGTIVGIVKDFHTSSLHSKIQPVILFNDPSWRSSVMVRFDTRKTKEVLASLEKQWKSVMPLRPFSYTFLDSEYDALYRNEQRISALVLIFSGIAIAIACFGLLGLASFTAIQRTKEVGIRKVLGATPAGIVLLLSKTYIKLLTGAFIIAVPLSYYVMNQWLESFAYRIGISAWYFVFSFVAVIVIALSTIGYHSIRASLSNPADTLKYE